MIDFLMTSFCCQIVLFAVYKIGLENLKTHRFNRFYLVSAVLFSLVLPFISIEIQLDSVAPQSEQMLSGPVLLGTPGHFDAPISVDYTTTILWLLYGLGFLLFAFRFAKNLARLHLTIRHNCKEKRDGVIYVLLKADTVPHTFLNYIFVNADEFQKRKIAAELFTHELTHARQKHSWDILFMETLRLVFWFNPVLAIYQKVIRLNHEFLADEAVIVKHDSIFYQRLLLAKAQFSNPIVLASSFNYSITKKRMIMMTKTISPVRQAAGTIFATLSFVVLFGFFGFEAVAQQGSIPPPPPPPSSPRDVKSVGYYYSNTTFHIKKSDGTTDIKRFAELSKDQIATLPPPPPRISRMKLSEAQFQQMGKPSLYAVWIDGKSVKNSELSKFKASDFVMTQTSKVLKNARSKKFPQPYQANLYTEKGFTQLEGEAYPKVLEWHFDANGSSVLNFNPEQAKNSQSASTVANDNERASFPGGFPKFYDFFHSEFKAPDGFKGNERLIIKFTIEADGKVSNVQAVRASSESLGNEAVRVMLKSPNWIPAKENGKAIRSEYHLPVALKY